MEAAEEEAPREAPSTYEHACMRAELLGLARPTLEEFEASRTAIRSANYDEDELEELERQRQQEAEAAADVEAELVEVQLTEIDQQKEELQGTSGKLDELSNILAMTQGKLNRFKTVCGSIKNLFKLRGEGEGLDGQSDGEGQGDEDGAAASDQAAPRAVASATHSPTVGAKGAAKEIGSQLSSQNTALDRLLSKAENAEASLNSQNKQIKSMLR